MSSSILSNCLIVDVSHWQPPANLNWQQAHDEGNVRGVIAKLMQNGQPDTSAISHLYNAYQAGITLLGCYDFGQESDDHVTFINAALAEFTSLETRLIALDAERSSPQITVLEAAAWLQGINVEEHRYPVLYMGRSGPDGTGADLPSTNLSKCDLWLPAYGPHADNLGSILPPGFRLPTSDTDKGGCLRLWQFTDGSINGGQVPGLGAVDQSYAIGFSSFDALTAWWGT